MGDENGKKPGDGTSTQPKQKKEREERKNPEDTQCQGRPGYFIPKEVNKVAQVFFVSTGCSTNLISTRISDKLIAET